MLTEIIGYAAAVLIGVSLGLTGGGGSILTIPVLVYLFGINPVLSTSYSLFIVGTTSLIGAYNNYRAGLVNVKTGLLFSISSIITVLLTRKFLVPAIPAQIFSSGEFTLTRSMLIMVLFAALMLAASVAMIRNEKGTNTTPENDKRSLLKLTLLGIGIGLTTGVLGAGGGFLLIPALVLLFGMPMKEAIGTSLLIIALNSLIGFAGDIGRFDINWIFLLKVSAIAVAGVFAGGAMGKNINGKKLKKGFGWFVLIMGVYIIIKELYLR